MNKRVLGVLAVGLLGTLGAPGCVPPTLIDGLPWAVRQYRVVDAKTQTIRGMPDLRVDSFLIDALKTAAKTNEPGVARENLTRVSEACHALALRSIDNEIDRLPRVALEELWGRYFEGRHRPVETREAVRDRYLKDVEARHKAFQARLAGAVTVNDFRAIVNDILWRVEASPKTWHGQGLLLAIAMASNPEPQGPLDRGGRDVDLYAPDEGALAGFTSDPAGSSSEQDALLAKYAPTIVQERAAHASYSPRADMIGTVRLTGRHDHINVVVDTSSPSVYAYCRHTLVGDRRHLQLVYVYWFPKRPPLKLNDAEAGHIDGATVRITLDANHRPAIFETIMNCGCYHRCLPSALVEEAARKEYNSPMAGKKLCIERRMIGPPDWIVSETVDVPAEGTARPILFSRAGYHGLAAVSFDEAELAQRNVRARKKYVLRPYDELEKLRTPYGYGSMFGADGLVHYAGRLEGWSLALTGMRSAGQPRQRGTQLIRWDQYDFDDPHLLVKCLRLPADF